MWTLLIGIVWAIGIFLLLAFMRGASVADQCYDDGHEAAVLRALKSRANLTNRAA